MMPGRLSSLTRRSQLWA